MWEPSKGGEMKITSKAGYKQEVKNKNKESDKIDKQNRSCQREKKRCKEEVILRHR